MIEFPVIIILSHYLCLAQLGLLLGLDLSHMSIKYVRSVT